MTIDILFVSCLPTSTKKRQNNWKRRDEKYVSATSLWFFSCFEWEKKKYNNIQSDRLCVCANEFSNTQELNSTLNLCVFMNCRYSKWWISQNKTAEFIQSIQRLLFVHRNEFVWHNWFQNQCCAENPKANDVEAYTHRRIHTFAVRNNLPDTQLCAHR